MGLSGQVDTPLLQRGEGGAIPSAPTKHMTTPDVTVTKYGPGEYYIHPKPVIYLNNGCGVWAVVSPDFGVGSFGSDLQRVLGDVFDAMRSNARIAVKKQAAGEALDWDDGPYVLATAEAIIYSGDAISTLFHYDDMNYEGRT